MPLGHHTVIADLEPAAPCTASLRVAWECDDVFLTDREALRGESFDLTSRHSRGSDAEAEVLTPGRGTPMGHNHPCLSSPLHNSLSVTALCPDSRERCLLLPC